MSLKPNYIASDYESKIFDIWSEYQVGNPEAQAHYQQSNIEDTYSILMPPPNVTGTLHAGHAFQHYLMDSLSRKARLSGKKTLWYPGIDHAGIQLEGVIDKLIKQGEFDEVIKDSIPAEIEKEEYPQWLKDNQRSMWLDCAWKKVNEWKSRQKTQASLLGDTPATERSLFTLDERASRMVYYAFEKYWQDGLIYKGEYFINWSVGLQTALSDFQQDVEWEEQKDPFITFVYTLESLEVADTISEEVDEETKNKIQLCLEEITISTVRPETIFADVAIAIHPTTIHTMIVTILGEELSESIIQHIKNGTIVMNYGVQPLNVKGVRLVISDKVDKDFGTGALKITPAHDTFDYELYKEFVEEGLLNEGFVQTINRSGKLTEVAGEFEGLTVLQGRMSVIKRLLESGYIPVAEEKEEILPSEYIQNSEFITHTYNEQIGIVSKAYPNHAIDWNYTHNVLYCERSKTMIEPLISTEYFIGYHIKSSSLNSTLQHIGLEGLNQTKIFPESVRDQCIGILDNLHDWCISRKLVWGHRIPVWYNLDTNPSRVFYSYQEIQDNPELSYHFAISRTRPESEGNWVQEEKVFDTWFSSCIWPLTTLNFFDTLHGSSSTDFDEFYPTQVLVTGGDILYAWVVRMILLCTYWTGKTPFKELVITPTILDEKGKKMSKSLGNGLQPEEAISKFSSDALRLSMLSGMIPGRNMKLGGSIAESLCEKYRNLGNKIWNVARFLENTENKLTE